MKQLEVIVVGAGIAGLQTALALAADGHNVTVLESAKAFEEVGAGIRVSCNASKLSRSWGVDFSRIKKETSLGNRFVDWKGKLLLDIPFNDVEDRYGAPYYFIHRADLVSLLAETATSNDRIKITMGARVVWYDFATPSVVLQSGATLTCDLVVCADGIKSSARDTINRSPLQPQDTGDVAYRILVPAGPLLQDPEMADLVRHPWSMHWMGPEGHAVGYPLRGGDLYNIIIDVTHNSDLGEALPSSGEQVWKSARSNAELVERFKDWCPQVRKLCGMAGEYLKWRLADFTRLDHWVSESGRAVLLGDACHPMMPYMAQGAAQATEDAACLAAVLRQVEGLEQLGEMLGLYERLRKPRTSYVARNTRVLQEWLHLYDGPLRDKRDEMMRNNDETNPIFWGWTRRKDWLFEHDARALDVDVDDIPPLPPLPPDHESVYKNR